MKIPSSKPFQIVPYLQRVKFGDLLEDIFTKQPNTASLSNGWFSVDMMGTLTKTPKITQALSLAGVDITSSLDIFRAFERDLWSRNAQKTISADFALSLVRYFRNWTEFDSCDPLAITIDYLNVGTELLEGIEARYGDNLLKIAQAYFDTDYSPLENYDMTQTETPNITRTTDTNVGSKTTTTSNNDGSVYGFNSANEVPVTSSDSTVTSEGLYADNHSHGTDTETGTRTLTRHGNIGVTTSQQMLESELNLRKFDFLERVLKAFEEVLFSKIY